MNTNHAAAFVLALIFIAFAIYDCSPARSQDGHAENHDWLSKLTPNDGRGSCCNAQTADGHGDCRIAQARQRPDGQWEAYYKGTLIPGSGMPLYWDWFIIP